MFVEVIPILDTFPFSYFDYWFKEPIYLRSKRNGLRNQTIFLLSVKSGLRAKEISQLRWKYVLKSDGETIDDYINLPNSSSKGKKW